MHATPQRIVSLLPGATEMIAALGLGERLVAVSHECDFPATVTSLPRVTATPIDRHADSAAIDAAVRSVMAAGGHVIGVDTAQLRHLEPDLIITQVLCEVCAVSDGTVHQVASILDRPPTVVALQGRTLEGVFDDLLRVATALGVPHRGETLVAAWRDRLEQLRRRFRRQPPRRVVVIDGNAYTSRAGPRLIEAVEVLGELLAR